MRSPFISVGVVLAALVPISWAQAGTCHHAYAVEGQAPPVFDGINTTGTGFVSYYWAWGENPSDQGSVSASFVDGGSGLALNNGILWANSDSCSGQIDGTGVLVEAQTASGGGLFALLAIGGAEGNVDALQAGADQCTAQAIPAPAVTGFVLGSDGFGDYADISLGWDPPLEAAWAVSTISPVHAGYGLYYRTGSPVDNGDKAQFSRAEATPSGSVPYVVDDSDTEDGWLPAMQTQCRVRIRPGDGHYFALSLIFDGSGAVADDPQADASAVETLYVSASSNGVNASDSIFADGFESGNTSAWSDTLP